MIDKGHRPMDSLLDTQSCSADILRSYKALMKAGKADEAVKSFQAGCAALYELGYHVGWADGRVSAETEGTSE